MDKKKIRIVIIAGLAIFIIAGGFYYYFLMRNVEQQPVIEEPAWDGKNVCHPVILAPKKNLFKEFYVMLGANDLNLCRNLLGDNADFYFGTFGSKDENDTREFFNEKCRNFFYFRKSILEDDESALAEISDQNGSKLVMESVFFKDPKLCPASEASCLFYFDGDLKDNPDRQDLFLKQAGNIESFFCDQGRLIDLNFNCEDKELMDKNSRSVLVSVIKYSQAILKRDKSVCESIENKFYKAECDAFFGETGEAKKYFESLKLEIDNCASRQKA